MSTNTVADRAAQLTVEAFDAFNETFMLGLATPAASVPTPDNKYFPGAEWKAEDGGGLRLDGFVPFAGHTHDTVVIGGKAKICFPTKAAMSDGPSAAPAPERMGYRQNRLTERQESGGQSIHVTPTLPA